MARPMVWKEMVEDFRIAAHKAVDLLADYLEMLPDGPAYRHVPVDHRDHIVHMPLPIEGISALLLVEEIARDILPYPMGSNHPSFFGWVNSPALPSSVLGALMAAGFNASVAGGDQAGVYVEHAVLRWLKQMLGLDDTYGGVLTSGGSSANLIGLAVGRNELLRREGWDARADGLHAAPSVPVYATVEAHSSLIKAIELLGIGHRSIRYVPLDSALRLNARELRAMVEHDRPRGAIVCASIGTVNSGAVDPIDAVADIAAEHGLWLHVDGAYGAVGRIIPGFEHLYNGLERADSLSVDPHKWLYVAVECGCALVRDADAMRRAFSLVPPYLRDASEAWPWFSEYTFEQTRPLRALKLWAALRERGLAWYRDSLARDCALARRLGELVAGAGDFELAAPVELGIVAFRCTPRSIAADADAVDRLNDTLPASIQRDGRIFMTGSRIGGRPVLRACFVNFRTPDSEPERILEVIRDLLP